jgi:hypothetical protein
MLTTSIYWCVSSSCRCFVHDRAEGLATSGGKSDAPPPLVQRGHHMNNAMHQCIQLCRDCHAMCMQTIAHCLKLGGAMRPPITFAS